MNLDNPTIVAVVVGIFGGAGLEVSKRILDRSRTKAEISKLETEREESRLESYRHDIELLRQQLEAGRAQESKLWEEVNTWRESFYELRQEKDEEIARLTKALEHLKKIGESDER